MSILKPTPKFKQSKKRLFPAWCYHVVDGDTIHCLIDLGFDTYIYGIIRLSGINASELKETDGTKARDYLVNAVYNKEITLEVLSSKDKYGRRLAEVYVDGVCINEEMKKEGFAVEYHGGKR